MCLTCVVSQRSISSSRAKRLSLSFSLSLLSVLSPSPFRALSQHTQLHRTNETTAHHTRFVKS
uniref:Uncharacterized protein n=1 Tax=Periophthalmus magnuspinnatus TaxID=409849 RepID=A0A3B3Z9Q0_9GOBI